MSLNVVHGPRGPHGAAGKVLFRPTPLTKKSKRFNIIMAFEDAEQKEGDIPATAPSTQAPDDAGDPANPPSRADLEEQLAALIEFQYVVSQKIAEITARLHGD